MQPIRPEARPAALIAAAAPRRDGLVEAALLSFAGLALSLAIIAHGALADVYALMLGL
ncbi:MAG TPA: hypothetical protein VMB84_10195 [Stellaceae bacterium]|nr:hypothetical protein [Stellaceae bacterium]